MASATNLFRTEKSGCSTAILRSERLKSLEESMGVEKWKKLGLQTALLAAQFVLVVPSAHATPAFARKYGLACSACHEAWPMLNNFGQTFKDNGYQLENGRDSPIYQDPAYWPIMFRVTPYWHRENNNREAVDAVPGNPTSGQ